MNPGACYPVTLIMLSQRNLYMGYVVEKTGILIPALIGSVILLSNPLGFLLNDSTSPLILIKPVTAQPVNSTAASAAALIDRANNLDRIGRYDEAASYYNKSLAINSSNIDALNGIANDLDNLKRYDEAVKYYDNVLALDPNNAIAINGKADDLEILKNRK
ncbi:MAG TPA: tetratricopeptide repeat protein [Nitrososphaeraceae archaeon]|nr:tetratricopeptide repeat protein [Nitrososphaeraceae archaeon]